MSLSGWAADHWPGISGCFLGAGALWASLSGFVRGKKDREARAAASAELAERELTRIREHVESEGQRLLDIRAAQISDNATKMAELQGKVQALEQLYGRAVVCLQEANLENERLKREIERYERNEAQLREQLREHKQLIESLQRRVRELENGKADNPRAQQ